MFQGLTMPIAAKVCAAALVVGGAGVATYEAVDTGGDAAFVASNSPDALAFGSDSENQKKTGTPLDVDDRSNPRWETDRKVPVDGEDPKGDAADVTPKSETKESDDQESKDTKDEASEEDDKTSEEDDETSKDKEDETEADEDVPTVEDDDDTFIEILWPEPDSHWDERVVAFEGEAEPGSEVFAGRYKADINDRGEWRIELILSPGANKAVLKVVDEAGNVSEDSITVWLDVEEVEAKATDEPKEDPKDEPEEAVEVEFSANQQYGECDAEIPYDVFWGTATPNSVVRIASDYGSATIEVGPKGHWEKKVWFKEAPRGVEFPVYVAADNGEKTFWFYAVPLAKETPDTAVDEEPAAKDNDEAPAEADKSR